MDTGGSILNEEAIEQLAIEIFQREGYIYSSGASITGESGLRKSTKEVLLKSVLEKAVHRINPNIAQMKQAEALKKVYDIMKDYDSLLSANEAFHHMLREGVKIQYQHNGEVRGDIVRLIDFTTIENNEFRIVNQCAITENNKTKRLDCIVYVNGIPLVVIELKNPISEHATLDTAYEQLRTYKETIPSLFSYNAMLVISDGLEAKAGSISSGRTRFMAWKSIDGRKDSSSTYSEIEMLICGMLNTKTLLDLLQHFIVFEKVVVKDATTKITTIQSIKKIAGYHQYYAVNKAVESVRNATKEEGNRKGGVIWHTQGSGKSLSMVFTVGKLVLNLDNPTIVVITDRNDLDEQLFDTFAKSKELLRQEPVQAKNREHLKELLRVASGGIVFTTIQKFQPEEGNVYDTLSERKNIVVFADEAHRTQYGFHAKTVDEKDEQGTVIGKKTVYGFAKYMRDALPHATYLGFTGTPIEHSDVNTKAVFGDYVDIYDISQSVKDGATVKIFYESRLAKITISEEGKKLIEELDAELDKEDTTEVQKAKGKWTQLEALIGSKERIRNIANDIVSHFEERQRVCAGKGMIVSVSRRVATLLYAEIVKLRPEWHGEDIHKGAIKVVMTASADDGPEMEKFHTTKEQRKELATRMRNDADELQLVIVCDMWLTGFDAPCLHTLYIDKPMKGHNLMQAIARVNRVYKDKPSGLVVDYLGIASDLKQALSFYSDNGGTGEPTLTQDKAVEMLEAQMEIVIQMLHSFEYTPYFTADSREKLHILRAASNHIMGLENGKTRFINEVKKISRIFSMAMPHEKAVAIRDEVAFLQAILSVLEKFTRSNASTSTIEKETVIRQIIDGALVSESIIDIFDAAGIKKPDISILSDEFLAEIQNMEHKNIALEMLKKLLEDEINLRTNTNIVESKSLMKLLQESIQKYHNKSVSAVEIIDELISLGKDIKVMDAKPQEMGLSKLEYAFYTAIASNESAQEVLQEKTLRDIAILLTKKIRESISVDWTKKESVQATLRKEVKRILKKYGYPPDQEKIAVEIVLEQANLCAMELLQEK